MDYERTAGTAAGGGHKKGPAGSLPVNCKLHKAARIIFFNAMRGGKVSAQFGTISAIPRIQRNPVQSVHPAHFPRNRRISSAIGAFGARSAWP